MTRFARIGLALAALIGLACAAPAAADEPVTFPAAAARGQSGAQVRGTLARPKGAGPFAAVILLHSCLGLPVEPPRHRIAR